MTGNARAATVLLVTVAALGCGKKGPPLAPFVRIPAAIDQISAARLGSDVYVTLTLPSKDIDATVPAHVSRVEVYGYTGRTAPSLARWPALGSLIATVPVAPAPLPDGTMPLLPDGRVPPANGASPQGTAVTIRDTLTADELVQGPEDPVDPRRQLAPLPGAVVLPARPLQRFYLAIPFSDRGRNGPPGTAASFVITPLPDSPPVLNATYTSAGTTLTWEPSGGLLGFLVNDALPIEPAPFDVPEQPAVAGALPEPILPPGPTRYNVYRDVAPDPQLLPIAATTAAAPAPQPLNTTPLTATSFADNVEFERERCYTVRSMRGTAPNIVVGEPSLPRCIRPVDVFPPAPPAQPAAVATEGAISLIWDPNSELDLGGYLVLRRELGSDTLLLLTETPVLEARFRDTTVKAGTRYRYTVVAVDGRMPLPNMSAESLPVEETAR